MALKESRAPNKFARYVPGIQMLRTFDRSLLSKEFITGCTVFALLVPSAMAYGELAGVNPVAGLYTALGAMLLFAFFTTTRQLVIGPEATAAILVATSVSPLAGNDPVRYAALAAALAILVGIFSILAGVVKLGFVADFLSKPILIGYITGTTLIVIGSQLGKMFGISLNSSEFFSQILELVSRLDETHTLTLAIGLVTIAALLLIRRLNPALPGPLLAVAVAIIASTVLDLAGRGVAVVGAVPAGLPQVGLPALDLREYWSLLPAALALTIIVYADEILTARTFAAKHNTTVDANQEFLAIGAANLGAGFASGFVAATSSSRTAVDDQMGGKTQVVNLIAAGLTILFLLWFTPLLAPLPKVVLGAVIIVSASALIDIPSFQFLRRVQRAEFWLAIVTLLGVLILGILPGVLLAVTLSLVNIIYRISRPHDAVLDDVQTAGGIVYRGIAAEGALQAEPGLVVYRFDAPLVFANTPFFDSQVRELMQAVGADLRCVILDAEAVSNIDTTALAMLEQLHNDLKKQNAQFWLARVSAPVREMFERGGLTELIGAEHIYPSVRAAVDEYVAHFAPGGTTPRSS